jgi:beta-glucanase (GH16 family)
MGHKEDEPVSGNDRGGARRRLFVFALVAALALAALPAGAYRDGSSKATQQATPALVPGLTIQQLFDLLFWWLYPPSPTTTRPTTTTTRATTTTASTTTTTASTTTLPGGSATCGTTVILKANGTPWECTFSDDFAGTTLDRTKWLVQETATSGFSNGGECHFDRPSNVAVADGSLSLIARRELLPFQCRGGIYNPVTQYSSGMVSTLNRFSQTYGRFEVRARLATARTRGIQTAFWLWPVNDRHYGAWPRSGEIDFMEWYSSHPDRVIPYVHYDGDATDPSSTNTNCLVTDVSQMHTYAVEWTTQSIKVLIDGTVCIDDHWTPNAPLVKPQPFDQPFFLSLTQAIGRAENAPDYATTFPATTQIDYVRVWR